MGNGRAIIYGNGLRVRMERRRMGCRYVVARPSAIISSSLYRGAHPSRGASDDTRLLRWNESSKQQQGKERLVYYLQQWTIRTNKHTRWLDRYGCGHRTRVWRTISAMASRGRKRRRRVNTGCCWRSSREKTSKKYGVGHIYGKVWLRVD